MNYIYYESTFLHELNLIYKTTIKEDFTEYIRGLTEILERQRP